MLTHWAVETTLDEGLPPETAEELPVPEVKVRRTKTRIRLGRIRRARLAEGV